MTPSQTPPTPAPATHAAAPATPAPITMPAQMSGQIKVSNAPAPSISSVYASPYASPPPMAPAWPRRSFLDWVTFEPRTPAAGFTPVSSRNLPGHVSAAGCRSCRESGRVNTTGEYPCPGSGT